MYFGSNEDEQTIASWIENELAALEKNIEQLESDHKVWCEKMTSTQEITYEIGLAQFKVAK
ncbi:hypothetical protein [Ligilactobacillus apodemi]|uniref:hypothetical protein n=1 Tax=Ligilactobacillus apodemi TaxID=307126 RepID=UPI00214C04A5|nr:hypothetical protein [Ligilactobacillus apodemi]MCR1902214.1 hypothetical protein [Ligilactobacillus apodemi]